MSHNVETSMQLGKEDAERLIAGEKIEYDPFIAISDLHLVRKTVPISLESFRKTVRDLDPELWSAIEKILDQRAAEQGDAFSAEAYAQGFAEGVAAVWEKIRDQVL